MPVALSGEIQGEQQLSRRLLTVSSGLDDFSEPFDKAESELLKTFDENFDARGGLFGGWPPAKHDYGHPLMEDTGELRGGFEGQTAPTFLRIMNPVSYFPYHQSNEARQKLPRRVMMKLDQQRKEFIQKAFQEYIREVIRRSGGGI